MVLNHLITASLTISLLSLYCLSDYLITVSNHLIIYRSDHFISNHLTSSLTTSLNCLSLLPLWPFLRLNIYQILNTLQVYIDVHQVQELVCSPRLNNYCYKEDYIFLALTVVSSLCFVSPFCITGIIIIIINIASESNLHWTSQATYIQLYTARGP